MADESIRVGIAGCGQIARHLHIPGFDRCPRSELVAFYNHRKETVADLLTDYPTVNFFDDYERFLDEGRVQAISICTPNVFHAEMTLAALRRGIHVLVEKPMAVTLAEAQAMIQVAREFDLTLMVAYTQRFYPSYARAYEIMQTGALGPVHQIHAHFGHSGPLSWSPRGGWFLDTHLAGTGVIGDLAVHKVDLIRHLTGLEVLRVGAFRATLGPGQVEDNVVAILELEEQAQAVVTASWTTQGKTKDELTISGEDGVLQIGVDRQAPLVLFTRSGERQVYDVPFGMPKAGSVFLTDQMSAFVEASMGLRPNPISGEEGYRALEVCTALGRSAILGEIVPLPLDLKLTTNSPAS